MNGAGGKRYPRFAGRANVSWPAGARHSTGRATAIMPTGILQLYCTHCTYGTSALHRNAGAIREQVFEYSLRAGSVEQQRSHDLFRQIEPCLYFRLPQDTPAAEVRSLTADTCPWQRLVYFPSISGCRMLSQVCYRNTDTRGRPGSYFAHVLLSESPDSDTWSAVDCLKLWGAPFWESADSDDHPFELPQFSELPKLSDSESLINDQVLLTFLTTPPKGEFLDEPEPSKKCIIPQRWRDISVDERRQLLVDLLRGLLELDWERQERLMIAVEPSVAALLFYGALRCLPRQGLARKVSFSTYESHADRPAATLVACTFFRPLVAELLPETYRAKSFVRNTYQRHPPRPFRNPDARYAKWIVSKLIDDGPNAVDEIVADLDAAGAVTTAEWEQAVARHEECQALVAGNVVPELGKTLLPQAQSLYAGRVLARLLQHAPAERIQALAATPAYLPILDLVGAQPAFATAKKVTFSLLKALPKNDGIRNRLLKLPRLASAFKGLWLAEYFKKSGSLPAGLPALWEPNALKTGGPLAQALDRLDAAQAGLAAVSVPEQHLPRYVALVAESAARDPAKQGALVELLKKLEADAIGTLLAANQAIILRFFPPPQPQIARRLEQLLDVVLADASQFSMRLNALVAGQTYLPRTAIARIESLVEFRDAIKAIVHVPPGKKGMFGEAQNPEWDAASDRLLNIAERLFDDDPIPPATKSTLAFFESVMKSFAGDQGTAAWQSLGRPLLVRQLQRMNDSQFVRLLSGAGAKYWLKQYPFEDRALAPALVQRLQKLLDELADNTALVQVRVPVLSFVREYMPVELQARVTAWERTLACFVDLRNLQRKQPGKFDNLIVLDQDVGGMTLKLAKALAKALNGQVYVDRKNEIVNRHIIYDIGQELLGNCFLEDIKKVFTVQLQNSLPRG